MRRRRPILWFTLLGSNWLTVAFCPGIAPRWHLSTPAFCDTSRTVLFMASPSDNSEDIATEEDYEIKRYRNRATLLQETLRQKLEDLQELTNELSLAESKVKVLQDVVKRLSDKEKLAQKDTARRIQEMENELKEVRAALDTQKKHDQNVIDTLKQTMEENRLQYEKQQISTQEKLLAEQEKRGAMKNEMLHLDEKLEQAQDELNKLQKKLTSQETESQKSMKSERRQREKLEKQLAATIVEKEKAHAKLRVATEKEEERQESIEIAKGAVQAAEQREKDVRQQLEQLEKKFELVLKEKDRLENNLKDLKKENEALALQLKEFEAGQEIGANLDERLREAEDEMKELRRKAHQARETLQQERVTNASMQKFHQLKFDQMLKEERANHEQEMQRLRDELFQRIDSLEQSNGSGRTKGAKRGVQDDALPNSFQKAEPRNGQSNKRGRIWKKLSPRSWFSKLKIENDT